MQYEQFMQYLRHVIEACSSSYLKLHANFLAGCSEKEEKIVTYKEGKGEKRNNTHVKLGVLKGAPSRLPHPSNIANNLQPSL